MSEKDGQYELALGEHQHDAHVREYKIDRTHRLMEIRQETIRSLRTPARRKPIDWRHPPRYKRSAA